jgi:two-component system chemotaxis response regulator CheB
MTAGLPDRKLPRWHARKLFIFGPSHIKYGEIKTMTAPLAPNQEFQGPQPVPQPIRVVIVDDSKLIRRAVRGRLSVEPDIRVVGEAENGAQALDLVSRLKPDVITLDVNMPVMDGLSTIKHLMIKSPTPTVMLSTLTDEGAKVTFDALRYGATDFLRKPSRLGQDDHLAQQDEIIARVRNAAKVSVGSIRYVRPPRRDMDRPVAPVARNCEFAVAIGASEGGYGPLLNIIPALDPVKPVAYVVVMHTGERYLEAFRKYLSACSAVPVRRASDGMPLNGGTCYLVGGDEYATLVRRDAVTTLGMHPNPFPGRRGSIDMLMFSAAETFAHRAAGIVLSGIGLDGSQGLGEIKRHGGVTFVQKPATCLHREMALAAIRRCKVDNIASDTQIAALINTAIFN